MELLTERELQLAGVKLLAESGKKDYALIEFERVSTEDYYKIEDDLGKKKIMVVAGGSSSMIIQAARKSRIEDYAKVAIDIIWEYNNGA